METKPLNRQAYGASGINILCGLWLIAAPFVLGYVEVTAACWNDILVGILVIIGALLRSFSPVARPGWSWVNILLGGWLILAPFVLGYAEHPTPLWNNLVLGATVLLLAWLSSLGSR